MSRMRYSDEELLSDDDNDRSNHDESDGDLVYDCDETETYPDIEKCSEDFENTDLFAPSLSIPTIMDFSTISWSTQVDNTHILINKFQNNEGPVHNLPPGSPCVSYFKLFFTDEMAEEIRLNTNKYANFVFKSTGSIDKLWTPIESISEIWATISVIFIMGIMKFPDLAHYWSSHPALGNDMIKKMMPRNRFQKILQYLHLSDREKEYPRNTAEYYLLQKVEPFMSAFKEKCRLHISLPRDLSIKEVLLKYRGRLGIIQHSPPQSAKVGLKIWMLSTSNTGYVYNFEIYCGRNDNIDRSEKGLGYDVITHFTYFLQQPYHHLYFSDYFTSIPLMVDLLDKNVYACGIMASKRKYLSDPLSNLDIKPKMLFQQCEEHPNLLCSTWYDDKEISVISTNEKMGITKVTRKKGTQVSAIECPMAVSNYNVRMVSTSKKDQEEKYSIPKKSMKWWFYLFWFLLDMAMQNAYVLYTMTNNPPSKKILGELKFKLSVIDSLSENYSSRKRKATNTRPNDKLTPINAENINLHKKAKIAGRKRVCVQCRRHNRKTVSNRRIESTWECIFCNVCLCEKCFGPYHQENMLL